MIDNIIISFTLGFLLCWIIKFEPKEKGEMKFKNRWDRVTDVNFQFDVENHEFTLPVHLKSIVKILIPTIIQEKAETLNYEDIVIGKGKNDLRFRVYVEWRESKSEN
jgi:hypothetical protein